MTKKILTATIIDDETELTLREVCHTIQTDENTIIEMIKYEVIFPKGNTPNEYTFNSECLSRIKKAIRFHEDLEINFPGIALALKLLDQIDTLEKELRLCVTNH